MTILYVETNFLMSIATGRDPRAGNLLADPPTAKIVVPAVCYIEALSALESERKHYGEFARSLTARIDQANRDVTSQHAGPLGKFLIDARGKAAELYNDVQSRLFDALIRLSEQSESIVPDEGILKASVGQILIERDLTDNLILHCILSHSAAHPGDVRVFLSGNTTDFGSADVKAALRAAGVTKVFADAGTFLGWQGSLPT